MKFPAEDRRRETHIQLWKITKGQKKPQKLWMCFNPLHAATMKALGAQCVCPGCGVGVVMSNASLKEEPRVYSL